MAQFLKRLPPMPKVLSSNPQYPHKYQAQHSTWEYSSGK